MKDPTPRKRRKDARPSEIITAALQEFGQNGFAGTTLSGVASRAGISRTTIYLYFDTKEAIFEAAMRAAVETTIDDVAGMIATVEGDFRSLFNRMITLIYGRLVQSEASVILKILVAEGHAMPDLVALYRNEILSKGERTMHALIERGIARGELGPAARDLDVRVLMAPAIFAAIWTQVFDRVDPLDQTAFQASHVQMVCDALLATKV